MELLRAGAFWANIVWPAHMDSPTLRMHSPAHVEESVLAEER